jgi:hypothetical protein
MHTIAYIFLIINKTAMFLCITEINEDLFNINSSIP